MSLLFFLLHRKLRCISFARTDVNQFRLATWVQAQPAFFIAFKNFKIGTFN